MRLASEKRLAQMMRQAYGDAQPGSPARWARQQAEREWMERARLTRVARELWKRVHPEEAEHAEILREMRAALDGLREYVASAGAQR